MRAAAAPGHRDVLRVGRVGRRRLPRDGVRRGRDAARSPAARGAAVSPGAVGGRFAARGARPRPRRGRPAPGHQAGKHHDHGRPPRQAARLRHRAAARRRSRRQRGENGGRADRGRSRHRHARLHVARAAPRKAPRRTVGPLLARRRSLRGDRGAPGVPGGQPRRPHRREPVGGVRAARRRGRAGGCGRRARARDGPRSRAPIPVRRGVPRGAARAGLGRAAGFAAGHARDPRFPQPLAQSRRRLDRQRIRREPGRRSLAASGCFARAPRRRAPGRVPKRADRGGRSDRFSAAGGSSPAPISARGSVCG